MKNLIRLNEYTREEAHDIFERDTKFTKSGGPWGLQGIIRLKHFPNSFVFFVTYGRIQGNHEFDESVTDEGVLSWQSQASQSLDNQVIKNLINHDEEKHNIYLFLRTKKRLPYTYLGKIKYLSHDGDREKPVYFQWQILDWDPTDIEYIEKSHLKFTVNQENSDPPDKDQKRNSLVYFDHTFDKTKIIREGVSTINFKKIKKPDYSKRDKQNKKLGDLGEKLVFITEIKKLERLNLPNLAARVEHVSKSIGDHVGYDIKSYDPDGNPVYIEVKTTKGNEKTAFYVSANELEFSRKNSEKYCIHRVFNYLEKYNYGECFKIKGNLEDHVHLTPTKYRAELQIN